MGKRLVAGCMTGTSIDGLDLALIAVDGYGLSTQYSVKLCLSKSLGILAPQLRLITQRIPITAKEIAKISHDLAILHLNALEELIGNQKVDLVSVHGQTVYHSPPLSLQMINPTPIAIGLNVPVVTDLRAVDLASGGQGAPITPVADLLLYSSSKEVRCVVNLGGFCNLTILPRSPDKTPKNLQPSLDRIEGLDVCVCNQILDSIARRFFKIQFDVNGDRAFKGVVKTAPYSHLESHLKLQAKQERSLGTGDELIADWFNKFSHKFPANDLARSACAAIASAVVYNCKSADRIILAGGGVKNRTLVEEIRKRSEIPVELSDNMGIPSTHREAVAMAVLGTLCQDRIPITIPKITGASSRAISGVWVLP